MRSNDFKYDIFISQSIYNLFSLFLLIFLFNDDDSMGTIFKKHSRLLLEELLCHCSDNNNLNNKHQ